MAATTTNDLKRGMTLDLPEGLFQVVDFQHVKPGKGPAFVRTTLRNVRSGGVLDKTFRADERVEQAIVDKKDMQFLYRDGGDYVFMDNETYEQIHVGPAALGDATNYIVDGSTMVLQFYKDEIIGTDLPAAVELTVADDRARHPGRPRVGRPQAGHARDRPGRAGAAVRQPGRAHQGRHPQRRVPHPGMSPRARAATASWATSSPPRPRAGGRPASGPSSCCTRPSRRACRSPTCWPACPSPPTPLAVELATGVDAHRRAHRRGAGPAGGAPAGRWPAWRRSTGRCCAWRAYELYEVPERGRRRWSSTRRWCWPAGSAPTTRRGS